MNSYILRIQMMVAVDSPEPDGQVVAENFYSRLSELAQSDDHFLDCEVDVYSLPGNQPVPGETVTA